MSLDLPRHPVEGRAGPAVLYRGRLIVARTSAPEAPHELAVAAEHHHAVRRELQDEDLTIRSEGHAVDPRRQFLVRVSQDTTNPEFFDDLPFLGFAPQTGPVPHQHHTPDGVHLCHHTPVRVTSTSGHETCEDRGKVRQDPPGSIDRVDHSPLPPSRSRSSSSPCGAIPPLWQRFCSSLASTRQKTTNFFRVAVVRVVVICPTPCGLSVAGRLDEPGGDVAIDTDVDACWTSAEAKVRAIMYIIIVHSVQSYMYISEIFGDHRGPCGLSEQILRYVGPPFWSVPRIPPPSDPMRHR